MFSLGNCSLLITFSYSYCVQQCNTFLTRKHFLIEIDWRPILEILTLGLEKWTALVWLNLGTAGWPVVNTVVNFLDQLSDSYFQQWLCSVVLDIEIKLLKLTTFRFCPATNAVTVAIRPTLNWRSEIWVLCEGLWFPFKHSIFRTNLGPSSTGSLLRNLN